MAKCHENRKRRLRRRKRQEGQPARQAARRQRLEDSQCWLCGCGGWVEDGCHCRDCFAEPPWGCPCDWCQGDRYEDDEDGEDDPWSEWDPDDGCDYPAPARPVFTTCNVCGRGLVDKDEFAMGMCLICAAE
jgi:hypothetical protein